MDIRLVANNKSSVNAPAATQAQIISDIFMKRIPLEKKLVGFYAALVHFEWEASLYNKKTYNNNKNMRDNFEYQRRKNTQAGINFAMSVSKIATIEN